MQVKHIITHTHTHTHTFNATGLVQPNTVFIGACIGFPNMFTCHGPHIGNVWKYENMKSMNHMKSVKNNIYIYIYIYLFIKPKGNIYIYIYIGGRLPWYPPSTSDILEKREDFNKNWIRNVYWEQRRQGGISSVLNRNWIRKVYWRRGGALVRMFINFE